MFDRLSVANCKHCVMVSEGCESDEQEQDESEEGVEQETVPEQLDTVFEAAVEPPAAAAGLPQIEEEQEQPTAVTAGRKSKC